MEKDRKKSGICHYYLLHEDLFSSPVFTAFRKHSPYTDIASIGYKLIWFSYR